MAYIGSFELSGVQIKTRATSDEKEIEKHLLSFLHPSNNHRTKVIGFDAEWLLFDATEPETITKSKCATIQLCDGHTCLIIQLNHFNSFESWYYDSVIGFDVEWYLYPNWHLKLGTNAGSSCATIQFCDGHSCLIIQLDRLGGVANSWSDDLAYKSLLNFLRLPNITFVGVGIKENFAMLEKQYGIVCRNGVELGPLAATAMRMPRLSYCGVDELAFVVNGFDLGEHRPLTTVYDWTCNPLDKDLAKLATINVYSYFKIGSTLLQSNVVGGLDTGLVRLW